MSVRSWGRAVAWNDRERRLRAPWRLVGATLILVGAAVVALVLVSLLLALAGVTLGAGTSFLGLAVSLIAVAMAVSVALYPIARFADRRWYRDFGLRFDRSWWRDCAAGLVLGAGLQAAIVLVGLAGGWYEIAGVLVTDGSFGRSMVLVVLVFLAVGIYEELLLRGWLLTNLVEGLGYLERAQAVALAVVLSSALFGAMHLSNPGAGLHEAGIITLAGIFLAVGYVLTGELALPIGVHVTWNFFQGGVFGFGVSGLAVPATVLQVEPVGPTWITGGSFGPEAGVLGVGAIVLGTAVIAGWVRHTRGDVRIHPSITAPDLRWRTTATDRSRQSDATADE